MSSNKSKMPKALKEKEDVVRSSKPGTLLENRFAGFILCTAAEFVVLEIWLFMYGKTMCNDVTYKRNQITIYVNSLVAGAFTMNVVLNAIRLNSGVSFSNHHNIRITFYAVLCVNSIAAFSALTTFLHPNGTCTDYFGVPLNAEVLPEWITTVPLLGFMAISVDSKTKFSLNDKLFIGSLFLTIFLGFVNVILPVFKTLIWSSIFRSSQLFCFSVFLYLADKMVWEAYNVLSDNPFLPANSFRVHLATRKILLVRIISILFPIFPFIYALGAFKIINGNTVDSALMAASAFSKMIFAALCTDAKLEITHPSAYTQDVKSKLNKDRRIFLRYIFHELRAPLNSVTLGIQHLLEFISELGATPAKLMELSNMMGGAFNNQSSGNSVTSEIDSQSIQSILTSSANADLPSVNETLTMMNEATSYMDNVLNDVFAIHKIEEGSLKLIRKPFTLDSLVNLASEPLEQVIGTKKIRFEVKTDYSIPKFVKGDKYQLSHIVSKVLSNAVKYSPKEGKVMLSLSSPRDMYYANIEDYDPNDETITELKDVPMREYLIDVIDSGPGMSKEVIDSIFSPYDKTRPHGDLSIGKGSGLGLTVCKEIIEMHGGSLSCISRLGRGTTFTITVPLEVVTNKEVESLDSTSESEHGPFNSSANLSFVPGESFNPKSTWNSISLQQKMYKLSNIKYVNGNGDNVSQMTGSFALGSSSQSRHASVEVLLPKHASSSTPSSNSVSPRSTTSSQNKPAPILAVTQQIQAAASASSKTSKAASRRARGGKNAKEDTSNETENVTSTVQEVTKPKRRRSIKKSKTQNDPEATSASSSSLSTFDPISSIINSVPFVSADDVNSIDISTLKSEWSIQDDDTKGIYPFMDNLKQSSDVDHVRQTSNFHSEAPNKNQVDSLKVMVVDDVLSNRKLLAMLLTKRGFNVDTAEDGVECVNLADKNGIHNYDLIFLDNTMPNMTGVECVSVLRQKKSRTVVIGLTGNTLSEELRNFEAAGCDLAISKPLKSVDLEELLMFLNQTGGFQSQFYTSNKIVMSNKRQGDKLFEWKSRSTMSSSSSAAAVKVNDNASAFSNSWFPSSAKVGTDK